MLLNARSISISIAVLSFFAIAAVGWFSDLSPLTCCKRSLLAAVIVYISTSIAVKAISAILMDAMVDRQMNQQKEASNGNGN